MPALDIDRALVRRLHERGGAAHWDVPLEAFKAALEASAGRALGERSPGRAEVRQYLEGLHLKDLALATACRAGHEGAWEHFVREYRPVLYRSAHAIDPTGGARDLADSLHAELFGSTSAKAGGNRSSATFTVAAVWRRGSAPCSHSATSIGSARCGASSRCQTRTVPRL